MDNQENLAKDDIVSINTTSDLIVIVELDDDQTDTESKVQVDKEGTGGHDIREVMYVGDLVPFVNSLGCQRQVQQTEYDEEAWPEDEILAEVAIQ